MWNLHMDNIGWKQLQRVNFRRVRVCSTHFLFSSTSDSEHRFAMETEVQLLKLQWLGKVLSNWLEFFECNKMTEIPSENTYATQRYEIKRFIRWFVFLFWYIKFAEVLQEKVIKFRKFYGKFWSNKKKRSQQNDTCHIVVVCTFFTCHKIFLWFSKVEARKWYLRYLYDGILEMFPLYSTVTVMLAFYSD